MIDDTSRELLSRWLDGDLDAVEREQLEQRLTGDFELARERAALADLRGAVAELASASEPPDRLAALHEPLRRGVAPAGRSGRWRAAWLAAAATLLVGVGLIVEQTHRGHRPSPAAGRRAYQDTPIPGEGGRPLFQLRPLPTPAEEVPLGAADRLLARSLPDPELEPPEALEIVGPLERPPLAATVAETVQPSRVTAVLAPLGAPPLELTLLEPLAPGRWQIRFVVAGGRITAVPEPAEARLVAALVGVEVPGLADGEASAELTVVIAPGG
jgi:hypothetical protein